MLDEALYVRILMYILVHLKSSNGIDMDIYSCPALETSAQVTHLHIHLVHCYQVEGPPSGTIIRAQSSYTSILVKLASIAATNLLSRHFCIIHMYPSPLPVLFPASPRHLCRRFFDELVRSRNLSSIVSLPQRLSSLIPPHNLAQLVCCHLVELLHLILLRRRKDTTLCLLLPLAVVRK